MSKLPINSLLFLGDSLSVGYGADQKHLTLPAQIISKMRSEYPGSVRFPIGIHDTLGPAYGSLWHSMTVKGLINYRPDIIILESATSVHNSHIQTRATGIGGSAACATISPTATEMLFKTQAGAFNVDVVATAGTGIASATAVNSGNLWYVGDRFSVGTGTGGVIEVTGVDSAGAITSMAVVTAGTGYSTAAAATTNLTEVPKASGQIYKLFNRSGDYEWIYIPQTTTATGYRISRGLFGTRARQWPVDTCVEGDLLSSAALLASQGLGNRLRQTIRSILSYDTAYRPIIVVTDDYFDVVSPYNFRAAILAIVAECRALYPNIIFADFTQADGTRIKNTTVDGTSGSAITFTNGGGGLANTTDTTISNINSTAGLTVGQYVWIAPPVATSPTAANCELVKIATIPNATSITVTRSVGSQTTYCMSIPHAYAGGGRLVPLNVGNFKTGTCWQTLGVTPNNTTFAGYGQFDSHPNTLGCEKMAEAVMVAMRTLLT
jgi:hypothetical protein